MQKNQFKKKIKKETIKKKLKLSHQPPHPSNEPRVVHSEVPDLIAGWDRVGVDVSIWVCFLLAANDGLGLCFLFIFSMCYACVKFLVLISPLCLDLFPWIGLIQLL